MEVIGPVGLPFEQLRKPGVEFGEERVSPIRHPRREVVPILPLEGKQGWCVVKAKQLKFWRCHVRSPLAWWRHDRQDVARR
jgi:hypothetical protein